MDKIDITCTATLRPKLLKETLTTHKLHLFKDNTKNMRLIINIDCIGAEDIEDNIREISEVVHDIGFGSVHPRFCIEPHFGKAFVWCMENVESEFFFHLEEDWRMLMDLDFSKLVDLFYEDPALAHLRLSMFRSEEKTCKNWNKFLEWNGKYFQVKGDERGVIGWAGHPSLNRTSFMKAVLPAIDPHINPEKQIKHNIHPRITRTIEQFKFGSFHPQNSPPAVEDIGRQWMVENGFAKAGNKAWFTNWTKGV